MVVGLGLTGCPTAAELDTPYEEYEPIPTSVTVITVTSYPVTSSTTSGPAGCDDSTVNEVMEYWCGSAACHGTAASDVRDAPLWLFMPTRATDFLDLPAEWENCGTELVINTTTPENSLIITSMQHTVPPPCDIEMPKGIDIPDEEYACIESWVYSLVAGAP